MPGVAPRDVGESNDIKDSPEGTPKKNARIVKRPKVPCFKKPKRKKKKGETKEESEKLDKEFDKEWSRQLKEQEDEINSLTADEIQKRFDAIDKAGGTKKLRVPSAQRAEKKKYIKELMKGGMSRKKAKQFIKDKGLHALHKLDIIAGGDPKKIARMGDGQINSSIGPSWKGDRVGALREQAKELKANGMGSQKMKVKLTTCK